mmetsp:Transcript_7053/g.8028  ORF Transcript_7053/g.8028 Transcript_7053/m.8028 type:complete len:134 (-) Transcript_7053:141-542(-)
MFNQHLSACDGELLKYDGDNIICKFNTSKEAIKFVLLVKQDIKDYNKDKEDDHQLIIKLGLAKGAILVSPDGDLFGDAWEDCCNLSEETAQKNEVLVCRTIKEDIDNEDMPGCNFELREKTEQVPLHYNITIG